MVETFALFHDQLKSRTAFFAAAYILCPLALILWRWLRTCSGNCLPVSCEAFIRKRRFLLWVQQSGIAFSSAVLFRDHILHSYYLSAEPDAVIAIILGLSAVLDTSLGEDTKYLRLSWLPLYYVSSVYILSTALEDPSRLHLASSVSCAFAAVVAMAHLVVDIDIPQKLEPPAEYTCNLLTYCMFSFVTKPILLLALWNGFLTIEDVPGLMDEDSCAEVYGALAEAVPATSLLRRLLRPISADVVKSGVFQFMSSVLNFASPLALGRIVSHVSSLSGSSGDADSFGGVSMSIHAAVGVLLLAPVLQAVVFGQMLATGRHVGIRIRAAVISLVFNKALCVDLTATGDGIGKLNNMISVDAQSIQTFMCYCHQIWSAFLEIVIAVTLLYMVLGKAAFAGVVGMLISVPSCFFLTKRMSRFQDELLERKDARMSSIGEILSSIRIIKLFAWEGRFEDQARGLRARELSSLRGYMFSRAGMSVLWEAIPTVVALITFLFRSYYLNEPLSAAQGYASLMMFSLLKHPLAAFPEMSGWCINALVALRRIAGFLAVDDILGSRRTIAAGSSGVAAETGTVVLNHACFWWNEVHNGPNDGPEKGVPAETRASLVDRVRRRLLDGALFRSDTRHVYTELEMATSDTADEKDVWSDSSLSLAKPVLLDVNATVQRGSLFAIIGPTGCGKSTLLAGLFGECRTNAPTSALLHGTVSYAPQVPWIQQASVRDNILFGQTYEKSRYDEVVQCCALQSDLDGLPLGDMTQIGERGVNLSGGQKQRVSLARAAYSRSDIVVMDDVLSAVDAHVGEHIFRNLICGILRGRTRILVTHQLSMVLAKADMVLCLREAGASGPCSDGESAVVPGGGTTLKISLTAVPLGVTRSSSVLALCHPSRLGEAIQSVSLAGIRADDSFVSILQSLDLQGSPIGNMSPRSQQDIYEESSVAAFAPAGDFKDIALDSYMDSPPPDLAAPPTRRRSTSPESGSLPPSCSYGQLISLGDEPETTKRNGIISAEGKASGAVSWTVYWYYLSSAGGHLYGPGLLILMLWNAVSWYFQNYSLGLWLGDLEHSSEQSSGKNTNLLVFVLCCLSVVLAVVAKNIYAAVGSLKASQKLHDKLVASVLSATISWFDATPVGRITNRFSTDIEEVDKEMMFTLQNFLDCVLGTAQVLIAVAMTVPILLLALTPIMVYIWWCAFLYIQGSREMKRLESVHKSPVFVLFSETLTGLATIRAFGHEARFFEMCTGHTDNMNRCHLYLWMCNRWLACRMQLCGAAVGGAVGYTVVYHSNNIGGAAAGLVLVFALNLTDNLTFMARLYADCQMNLNSVERLQEYSSVTSERYTLLTRRNPDPDISPFRPPSPDESPPPDWPTAGVVEFRDIVLQYESAPEPVLRRVSFRVPSKKKVGIVGRTGAGKSSLLVALFRVVEPMAGSILIDGVDVLQLPLHAVRSRLAIVPQDPILFRGSIRSNLDPFSEKNDVQLWSALVRVRMADHVANMPGGSGTTNGPLAEKLVADHGANLSVGQRQLLCMARAILRGATVLVMDEATANVDSATDLIIQETIRTEFSCCTVLCIAHRLHTVANCDLVLVMDRGRAAEFAPPASLLQDVQSLFYSMCKKSGNFDALRKAAMEAVSRKLPNGT